MAATLAGLTAAGLVWGSIAWACVGVVSLTTSSSSVQPGGTLKVTGREFASVSPVVIHLDSASGPVLATIPVPGDDTMTSQFTVSVTIPQDLQSGQHLFIATQDAHDMNSGAPARAVFYVGVATPAAIPVAARPAALHVNPGRSTSSLILIGVGVAGVSLLAVGVWSLMSARGNRRPDITS
jgi:hypothetical protein